MGVVHKAEDTTLHCTVALKFLPEELSRDHHALDRFRRDAEAASALNHSNSRTIRAIDEREGKPLAVDKILNIGIPIAEGMEAAHEKESLGLQYKATFVWDKVYSDEKVKKAI
jgi:eukaryotic-like serine/threonine-protein kinase